MRSSRRGSLADVPEQVWLQRGEANALAAFRRAARTVPAYRTFLKEHSVRPASIRTFEDFQQLPTINKENYVLKHDLAELMPGGKLDGSRVVTISSGSSGQPLLWPRLKGQDEGALWGLQAYYDLYDIRGKSTLLVLTLSLGLHVAGQYMTELSLRIARMPGSRLAVTTPGSSVDDTLELVKHLSPLYDQTILLAYPGFAQHVITAGAERGICWSDLDVFLMTGGESWTEGWREVMARALGQPSHPMRVAGVYGTADGGGIMGFETPVSIVGRHLAHERRDVRQALFGRLPEAAFVQFNPMGKFFESIDGELALTSWQAIPLIRYALHDAGEVLPFTSVVDRLRACSVSVDEVLTARGVRRDQVWQLPFLSCFGRSDGTVTVAAANVYPHSLQHVFAAHPEVSHFRLAVEGGGGTANRFLVYVELRDRKQLTGEAARRLEHLLHDEVVDTLSRHSSEYRESLVESPEVADPRIVLVPYGSGVFAEDVGRQKRTRIHKGAAAPLGRGRKV